MAGGRLLVVYKKSQLDLYKEHQPEALERLKEREPELLQRYVSAHESNERAIESVRDSIDSLGIEAEYAYRAEHVAGVECDLIVSVGGDGTLLDVSHKVKTTPLVGVNSSPEMSVGHFCATDAEHFTSFLQRWCDGAVPAVTLNRIRVTINNAVVPTPVLNEMLYAHCVPGAVSRYVLRCGTVEEEQKSSGIWISTAAGSTAAIRSAGGVTMEPDDHRLQYVVREPYGGQRANYQLLKGFSREPVNLLSKMRTAALYLDGHREQIELNVGDRVVVDCHPNPLTLLGYKAHGA